MGMSAAHCEGNVREFQSVWRVVTLCLPVLHLPSALSSINAVKLCDILFLTFCSFFLYQSSVNYRLILCYEMDIKTN